MFLYKSSLPNNITNKHTRTLESVGCQLYITSTKVLRLQPVSVNVRSLLR